MAAITPSPFVMNDVLLTLGADDYSATVDTATLTPSGGTSTWKGLKANSSFTFGQRATWTLDLQGAQSVDAAKALSLYLFDNEMAEVAFEYRPKGTGTSGFSGTVILTPGAIGGSVDSPATFSVSLGVKGKPTRV